MMINVAILNGATKLYIVPLHLLDDTIGLSVINRKPDLLFTLIIILSFGVVLSSYAAGLF